MVSASGSIKTCQTRDNVTTPNHVTCLSQNRVATNRKGISVGTEIGFNSLNNDTNTHTIDSCKRPKDKKGRNNDIVDGFAPFHDGISIDSMSSGTQTVGFSLLFWIFGAISFFTVSYLYT
jgi:hypothetical protein